MKKKIVLPLILGISVLIAIIVIALIIFYQSGNIPKKYRGTWLCHIYYIHENEEIDITTNIVITKNSITMSENNKNIDYEVIDDYLIITYKGTEENNDFSQYLLVDGDTLCISSDKEKDKFDIKYYKENSDAEKENELHARADYYAENIEWLANTWSLPIYKEGSKLYVLDKEELTPDEKKVNADDLNYYTAFYNLDDGTLKISINKKTKELSSISYSNFKIKSYMMEKTFFDSAAAVEAAFYTISVDKTGGHGITNIYDKNDEVHKIYSVATMLEMSKQIQEEYSAKIENEYISGYYYESYSTTYSVDGFISWYFSVK